MSVDGYDKAISHLDRLLGAMRSAPQRAAQEWLEQDFKPVAKSLVPVRTGELRDSIDGRVTATSVEVFATAEHARFVEEGTSKMEAQPFMGPAWEQTKGKLQKRIAQAIRKANR
ncbi:HK97-gp10 family putative phage morphogenesis protein [uncultured Novosphingobium sp.]|uniref:HK97-gp10 family putative phage morphogenesis protein n=1 Tax=uncultured Novosphingobium sp. TaxID=292277 RepID=UPI0025857DFD|nr:HK97-gp10 family putative phage morphogenesis protein [uncultured Novosphingobium sp.]